MTDQSNTSIFLPTLEIDSKEHTFIFSYDVLSSYLSVGTYQIKDDILIATTSDGKYRYLFEIIDKNTLSFLMEDSSTITVKQSYDHISDCFLCFYKGV